MNENDCSCLLHCPRLLLVDREPAARRQLSDCLRRHGYLVDWAGSAREALLLGRTGRWRAVILDIGVPAMNGVEFLALSPWREDAATLPLIFVSAYTGEGLLASLRARPATARARQPAAVRTFLATLERCLQSNESISA